MSLSLPSADLLLKQYIRLAQDLTDAATPQDNFLPVLASDKRYQSALQGVRLLAHHNVGAVVQALIGWRQAVNDDIKRNHSGSNGVLTTHGVAKRAAIEVLFLEASSAVLDAYVVDFWRDRHFLGFFASMQQVTFRWLLQSEEYVPHNELGQVRQHLVSTSVRIIGVLSRVRLADITTQFMKKLEEKLNPQNAGRSSGAVGSGQPPRIDPRTQLLRLCSGMRKTVLSFDDDSQLEQSTEFLKCAAPLNHTATERKSQVHHALCEMLTDILTPLVKSNMPHGTVGGQRPRLSKNLLDDWFVTILKLKNDIGQWVNKHNKHILVGYPIVTVLVCLVSDDQYAKLVDSMAEFLVKQMKAKEYRSLCFKCLSQLVVSYLVRNGAANMQQPAQVAWLDRATKPILANARKGGISAQEQQDFIVEIADLNPEYALATIMDLLQSDAPDAQSVALKALYQMVTSVPAAKAAALCAPGSVSLSGRPGVASLGSSGSFDKGSVRSSGNDTAGRRMLQVGPQQALDLIRRNQHPLDLQGTGHVLPKLTQVLARLLASFHSTYGGAYSWGPAEQLGRSSERQKEQLGLLSLLVRLLPFLKPDTWPSMRPLELLPAYSAHAEGHVRACAYDGLLSALRAVPAVRNSIITRVAAFLVVIPDEAVQALRECLLLLHNLVELWRSLLAERPSSSCSTWEPGPATSTSAASAASSGANNALLQAPAAQPEPRALSLHRIEGMLFVLLCSPDESIRQDTYKLLKSVRTLHEALQAIAAPAAAPAAAAAAAAAGAGHVGGQSSASFGFSEVLAGEGSGADVSASWDAGASAKGQHRPSASRDSVDWSGSYATDAPPQQPSKQLSGSNALEPSQHSQQAAQAAASHAAEAAAAAEPPAVYIMDVIEEVGRDVAARCYWDFGDWSNLWREHKPVPQDASFEAVMIVRDEIGKLRWLRCIAELAKEAAHMCRTSMAIAMQELLVKLGRACPRDSATGRITIPDPDTRRSEAWKAFVVVACVLPPALLKEGGTDAAGLLSARKAQAPSAREVVKALLASMAAAAASGAQQPPLHAQLCLMALGHCAPEHYPTLFEELPALVEEYAPKQAATSGRKRQAGRPEEMRKLVANVLRIVADAMPGSTLAHQPLMRARFCEFMRDTYAYLRPISPFSDVFWEVSQVAYCLCSVARSVGSQLVTQLSQPMAYLRDTAPAIGSIAAGATGASGGASPLAPLRNLSNKSSEPGTPSTGAGGGSGLLTTRSVEFGVAGQPPARKVLFDLFAQWSEEGVGAGAEYVARLAGGINQSLSRLRDLDAEGREGLKAELAQSAELLDHAARGAMAAMLRGPAFDTDARRPTGPVLSWIDRLLRQQGANVRRQNSQHHLALSSSAYGSSSGRLGPPKEAVARAALNNLLRSNLDMFCVAVDRCYDPDIAVATGYFQVVSEVYSLQPLACDAHVLLSLGLYKMVDASAEVREDALHMLHILSMREWRSSGASVTEGLPAPQPAAAAAAAADGTAAGAAGAAAEVLGAAEGDGSGSGAVVVLGNLQDTYQQFQFQLSAKLARDHPELSEALCEEMMTRQLECNDKVVQHPVLTCLAPWMENLAIAAHWKGTWCERLLKSMYYVTLRHGSELPLEIERLWSTLAAHKRNIIPMLDFLVTLGMHVAYQELVSLMEFFAVGKRIALYLARRSAQQTIDHLAYETSLALLEEDAAGGSSTGGSASGGGGAFGPGAAAGAFRGAVAGSREVPLEFSAALRDSNTPGASSSLARADSALAASRFPAASFTDMRASAGAADMSAAAGRIFAHRPTPSGGASVSASAPDLRDHLLISRQITQTSDSETSRMSVVSSGLSRDHIGLVSMPEATTATAAPRISAISVGARSTEDAVGGDVLGSLGNGLFAASGNSGNVPGRYSYGIAGPPPGGSDSSGLSSGLSGMVASRRVSAAVGGSAEPTSPSLRGLVTRPELALCLLSEVAYEHDEDFLGHLSLLFHVGVCCLDAEEPLVAQHAQQLLVHLLYSLSARYLEVEQDAGHVVECREATSLIQYLQSMKGRRLWAYEDVTLKRTQLPSAQALAALVEHVRAAMFFEAELADGWAEMALDWALHARSRHLACRSHQVLRALQPPLTSEVAATLLVCLQQCCALARASSVARECAVEVVLTLQALVAGMAPGKLVLYPQIFWTALSLLMSDYVHLYQQGLSLLSTCLQQLQLAEPTAQHVLLASAPLADEAALTAALAGLQQRTPRSSKGWAADPDAPPQLWVVGQLLPWAEDGDGAAVGPGATAAAQQLLAVQQLLWKGLLFPETRVGAVQVLAQLAAQLALAGVPAHAATPLATALRSSSSVAGHSHAAASGASSAAGSLHSSRVGAGAVNAAGRPPLSTPRTARGAYAGTDSRSNAAGDASNSSHHVSKSAPELRGIAARAARATGTEQQPAAGPGPGSTASSAMATPRTPGRAAAHQHSASYAPGSQHLPASVSGAAAAAASAAAAVATSASNTSSSRRRGGTLGVGQAVFEALLGTAHAQLLCSIVCVVPLLCAHASAAAPDEQLDAALQDCLQALCAACQAQGLPELGARLSALSPRQQQPPQQPPGGARPACTPTTPLAQLPALALQLSRAFLPRHAPWLLRKLVGVLAMPGAKAYHEPVLALVTALFRVPGLRLGPDATALVAGSGLMSPLVAMSQGPLCRQALEALDAIINFSTASPEVQQYKLERAAGAAPSPEPSDVDPSQLLSSCLPQLHLPTLIGRVLSSCGAAPPKKRRQRLMPFLTGSGLHDHARATDD